MLGAPIRTVVVVCAVNCLFPSGPLWDYGEAEYQTQIPPDHWVQPETPELNYAAQHGNEL